MRMYGVLVRMLALSLTVLLDGRRLRGRPRPGGLAVRRLGRVRRRQVLARVHLGRTAAAGGRQPGRRLALASLVPAALVGLLWYLSNRTWSAYESQRPPTAADVAEGEAGPEEDTEEPAGTPEPAVRPALGRPGFWYGRRLVARLRAAHTAAGFLTVSAAVAGAAARHDRGAGNQLLAICGWLIEAALAGGLITVLWIVFRRGRSERRIDARFDRAAVRRLPGEPRSPCSRSRCCTPPGPGPGGTSHAALPGDVTFGVLALGQGALVVALAVAAWSLHRHAARPPYRPAADWAAPPSRCSPAPSAG